MIQQVPLSELIEDLDIYPRGSVSEVRVGDLVYAMDAGAQLPPPVIDKATRKIVDGFHRTRAYRKRLGDDGAIGVDVQEFADDAAMLLESARINGQHGQPLGRYDQRIVHLRATALGATEDQVARALGVTTSRLAQITLKVAQSEAGPVPLKQGTAHLSKAYLTAAQVTEIRRMRGGSARSKAVELTRILREKLAPVDTEPELRQALADLGAEIEASLAPFAG